MPASNACLWKPSFADSKTSAWQCAPMPTRSWNLATVNSRKPRASVKNGSRMATERPLRLSNPSVSEGKRHESPRKLFQRCSKRPMTRTKA